MPIPSSQPTPETGLTAIEIRLLQKIKNVLPKPFLSKDAFEDANDIEMNRRILAYIDLVINDINWEMPVTGFTIRNFPEGLDGTLVLGVNVFTSMFMQMKWTLNDFSYTDNGLSLSLDRVEKLNRSHETMLKLYKEQVKNIKNYIWSQGLAVLATPKYGNVLGNFVKVTLGISA